MYSLYIANKNYSSWSLRPWILMKVLGIPFEEKFVPFLEGSSYEAFRKFSPTGLVPCLVDGGTTVWDSLAITEYLAEDHPTVWPSDKTERAWARCAAAEMHAGFSALRSVCTMNVGVRVTLNEISPALQKDVDRIDELWREGLERFGGPFLAGSAFTAVDAFFAPVAFRHLTYKLPLSAQADAYAHRLLDLPAMKAWYEAGIAETLRETEHEEEMLLVGTVTEDLRAQPASE
ncbi:glutathione S-transferase family protein [Pelagibacterium halotolerans]|uniref:glutathione S-transferase family protein n=1 Tax=Pelagibacterium halotolerans TaxID=531813 RepID=UPI00384A4BC3